ncbi:MAG TPA: Spy/CpxP family protein refolding chaperone [Pseudomonas sp.]|nr:Spy/CpxP family protein refolding chaperone [Pseudomonas sp.]
MSLKRTLIGLAGAALLLGGLTACGTHGPGHWNAERSAERHAKMIERISDKLELSAEQRLKLDALSDELSAQRKAIRGEGAGMQAEFATLIATERFDRDKAQAMLTQRTEALQTQGPRVLSALADFYDSLTAEQQQQVRERLERRRGWGWGGPGF